VGIDNNSDTTLVQGNYVGTDTTGTLARQNADESQQQKLAAEEASKQATKERNHAQELLREQSQRDLALAISRLSAKKTDDYRSAQV